MSDTTATRPGRKPMSRLKRDLIEALSALDKEDYVYSIEHIRAHSDNYQGNPAIKNRVILFAKDRAKAQSLLSPLVEKYQDNAQFVFKNHFRGCDFYKGGQYSDYRARGRRF